MPAMDLFELWGGGRTHAFEEKCGFCGAVIKDNHEEDCPCHPSKGDEDGDCRCVGVTYVQIAGITIPIGECPNDCDKKIMKIIEALIPNIAKKYPALLRERAKKLEATAGGLDEISQLTQDEKGGIC